MHYKHKHTSSVSLSIITKTSIAPGCEGFKGREQGKCISETLTIGENRALILVCVKVRERGSSPFAGDYQALHSATGMLGMWSHICSGATGSALRWELSMIGLNIADGHADSPIRWWSSPGRCSSCISQAGAWACGWSWSYTRTWENDGSDTNTSLPRHERTPSVNPNSAFKREALALFSHFNRVGDHTHLHFFHHLLPEGAHFGWDGDGHVLWAAVLTADSIEGARSILDATVIQIRLRGKINSVL